MAYAEIHITVLGIKVPIIYWSKFLSNKTGSTFAPFSSISSSRTESDSATKSYENPF